MGPNATGSPDGYMVQKSTNSGASWSASIRGTGPTSGFDKEMIVVDNLSASPYANRFYCGWTEFIGGSDVAHAFIKSNRSTDGGQTFSTPDTLRRSNGSSGGQGACLATGPNGEVYVCWADYGTGSVPANGIGFAKSTDGGSSFTTTTAFAYQGIRMNGTDPRFNNTRVNDFPSIAVDKTNGAYKGRIYIVYPNGGNGSNNQSVIQIRYSSDGGSSWSSAQTISISSGRQNWFPWIATDDQTGDVSVIYYSLDSPSGFSTNTYVAHSNNGGSSWENIKVSDVSHTTAPIPGFGGGYAGDYIGICGYGGKAYPAWMDDRNGTWQLYTSPLSYAIVASISGPTYLNQNQVGTYTCAVSDGIPPYNYQWWKEENGVPGPGPVSAATVSPNRPAPGNWYQVGTNSPTLQSSDITNFSLKCVVTDAIFKPRTRDVNDSTTTDIWSVTVGSSANMASNNLNLDEAVVQEIPTENSLNQNYPNPFNPSTRIRFALTKPAHIRLVVYDMLGREVARLADEDMDAGYHSVTWNASSVSSGVYIYRLSAGNFVQTKRMVVIK